MSLTEMYPAKNNSPSTVLSADISSESTTMTVENAAVLPAAPNIAVIGNSDEAEIIKYTAIDGNTLTIIRGVNGTTPGTWAAGSAVARNFTALDHEAFRENIIDLDTRKANADDVYNKIEVDTELAKKQNNLTFDSTPTSTSTNPVTSSGIKTALDGKAGSSHTHDDRYYTESEMNTKLSGKSDTSHTHDGRYYTESEMNTKLAAKQDTLENSGWVSVTTTNCSAGSIHYRKIGSVVQVVGTGIKLSSALGSGENVTVGTLPSTVRPQTYNAFSFGCAGTANPMFVNFETGGAIRFYTPSYVTSISTNVVCYFNTTFLVA